MTLEYAEDVVCWLHMSWIDPRKQRVTTVVVEKKMLPTDQLASEYKSQLFDKGVDGDPLGESYGDFLLSYRTGSVTSPVTEAYEPLDYELRHFIECVENGRRPVTDGDDGVIVVSVLEAARKSAMGN